MKYMYAVKELHKTKIHFVIMQCSFQAFNLTYAIFDGNHFYFSLPQRRTKAKAYVSV